MFFRRFWMDSSSFFYSSWTVVEKNETHSFAKRYQFLSPIFSFNAHRYVLQAQAKRLDYLSLWYQVFFFVKRTAMHDFINFTSNQSVGLASPGKQNGLDKVTKDKNDQEEDIGVENLQYFSFKAALLPNIKLLALSLLQIVSYLSKISQTFLFICFWTSSRKSIRCA